jgi:hypothetical protein
MSATRCSGRFSRTRRRFVVFWARSPSKLIDPLDAISNLNPKYIHDGDRLDRLAPTRAEHTFKHALVCDAAYDTLLRSIRQQLLARIAAIRENSLRESRLRPLKLWRSMVRPLGRPGRPFFFGLKQANSPCNDRRLARLAVI